MSRRRDTLTRVDREFDDWLKRMAATRVAKGKDKKMRSKARMTKAIMKHPGRTKLEQDIEEWRFDD